MSTGSQIVAGLAAALHVLFFYLESIVFTRNTTYRAFGVSTRADAEVVKPMALNQGFYNLFLAAGVVVGIVLWNGDLAVLQSLPPQYVPGQWALRGQGAVVLALSCMLCASLVLLVSSRGKLVRGAALQGAAPLIALILIAAS